MDDRAGDLDLETKLCVYRHFARTGQPPSVATIAAQLRVAESEVLRSFLRLRAARVLVLDDDRRSIRMAPPFSGVATPHVVVVQDRRFYANCAWDALGVPAALQEPAVVESRCGESGEALRLEVGPSGPAASDWVFHCLVPASHWWENIVFT